MLTELLWLDRWPNSRRMDVDYTPSIPKITRPRLHQGTMHFPRGFIDCDSVRDSTSLTKPPSGVCAGR